PAAHPNLPSFPTRRSSDLNYLKGLKPAAFDLLYWNTDGTNLPFRMHSYYLREMYLHNRLVEPDALTICGETINLNQIQVPSFFRSEETRLNSSHVKISYAV